ncbi:MAG: YfhO family protein, partial [Clostridia bacterium]|nr:YfhO family protein [Clostridia bacterium]
KTEGGYHVYENGNFAGYGFSYDYYMTYDYCERFSGSMRTELMLKAMLLSDEQVKKYRYTMSNITTADFDYIYSNDLSGDAAALNETAAIKFSTDERGFSATVKRDSRSLVFFSVPYAEGWSATVNGKAAEIEEVNAGFMAVAVDKGTSVIRFDYYTPGLDTGIYVSLAALIVFLIYFIAVSIYTFSHKPQLNYPEGEQLLARWIETEAAAAKEDEDSLFEPSLLDKLEDIPDKPGDFGGFNVDKNVFD